MSRIEIITIGDELVDGRLVDTNAAWMSERLAAEGLRVVRHCSVGDDRSGIADALQSAVRRSDAVLVSGGLGPTDDDLTAEAAATAFDLPVERHPDALEHVRRFFSDRGSRMTANNEKQADLPKGCTLLPNPGGTAVGFRLRVEDCRLYFMPGVPRELFHIFTESVLPDLHGLLDGEPPNVATLKIFGKGESEVAHLLADLAVDPATGVQLSVQYRATFPEIHVRLLASGSSEPAQAELHRLVGEAGRRLGKYLFATGGAVVDTTFADAVMDRAHHAGVTLAIADACSGGELSRLVSRTEHGSEVLVGSVVAPTTDRLTTMLQLSRHHPHATSATEAAAARVREQLGATTGIAVVGSPSGDGGLAAGDLIVAVCSADDSFHRELNFPVESDRFRRLAAYVALAMLSRHLSATND